MVARRVTDSPGGGPLRRWRRLPAPFRFGIIAATLEMAAILWFLYR